MKQKWIITLLCFSFLLPFALVRADSSWELEEVSVQEIQAKITAKEELYLFIGRPDHVHSQLAIERLKEAPKPVYYLNTKNTDPVLYKKFARKYKIKTSAYLGHFKTKQLIKHIPNAGLVTNQELEDFFLTP